MNYIKLFVLYILLIFTATGCRQHFSLFTVEEVIKRNNKLAGVLEHYRSDSLKLLAARFLIENLPHYYSYDGEAVDNYLKTYELYGTGLYNPDKVLDSIESLYGRFSYRQAKLREDIDIDPEYLIENIDWAFKVWKEQPWGKSICFDDFCEYILPYRIADEQLVSWREKIYNEFNPLLDSVRSLPEAKDPLFISGILLDSLSKRKFHFTESFSFGPHTGPGVVDWRSGNCREQADLLIYIFRAIGIPCGCDFMPLRGDNNVAHFWNFVLDKDRESYYCYEGRKPEPLRSYWGVKTKVYRNTFSRNRDIVEKTEKKPEDIYPFFRLSHIKDVTRLYSGRYAQKLEISRDQLYHDLPKDEIVYLCNSSWMKWEPVAWTLAGKNDISFNDVEGGTVLRLAIYKEKRLIPVTDPFALDRENRDIHFFNNSGEVEEVILINKYYQFFEAFPRRMIGGVFEGSNNLDFRKKDTLHIIKDFPLRLHNVVFLNNTSSYRYIRYIGPDNSHCNISEIAIYENRTDSVPLKGKVIGTPNGNKGDGNHEFTNVFDGNPYTSFDYYLPSGGWAGLDLGEPRPIFTPRNRDNYIRIGDEYELFHSQGKEWISSGVQIPNADSLVYSVPKGALLYLKNHTRGSNERIFEYVDGKQRYC